jgi:hypothetical protein
MARMTVQGTNGQGVNVREQPDASARRLGGLAEGATVEAGERAWRRIRTGVLEGWVAAEYLAEAPAEEQPSGEGPWEYFSAEEIAGVMGVPVANVERHWPPIHAALAERGIADWLVQMAALATVAIETASTFAPVREAFWLSEEWRRANLARYWPYYGRGHIQLTWRENYVTYGQQLGVDLVGNPDLALDPEISARVLALYFDQRGVAEAARAGDWGEVRRRVQGAHAGLDRMVAIVGELERIS